MVLKTSPGLAQDADGALAALARGGSDVAFETLVRRHQGPLRGFLRRVCVTADLADDVAQEVFLTAWRRIGQYRGEGTFRAWLFQIAWRAARDARRGHTRAGARDTEWVRETETMEMLQPAADARLDLTRALARLPEDQRAVLALCYAAGFTHAEAASALGLPLGTVKSHALRGRDKVLELLQARPEPPQTLASQPVALRHEPEDQA
jgi:RNA polymerase sigma factor (sigma-70 family)